jgi:V-type H+-transporting ATPase subunit e
MSGITILISFFCFVAVTAAGYYFIPKGQDQLVYRTSLVLTVACCWLMWAITYMAQINPLIQPERVYGPPGSKGGHAGHE